MTPPKILKASPTSHGYKRVSLSKNGKYKYMFVHKLVAICFLNHKPSGYKEVINHIDFNKLNNNVYNLEIVTPRLNNIHARKINSHNHTSKYMGVFLDGKMIRSSIVYNRKRVDLGTFDTEEDAAQMYSLILYDVEKNNGKAINKFIQKKKEWRNSDEREITQDNRSKKWYAKFKGKHIGTFNTKEEAALFRGQYKSTRND